MGHRHAFRLGLGFVLMVTLVVIGSQLQWHPSPPLTFGQSDGCRRVVINRLGTAKADLAISNTAVLVAETNESRCSLMLYNSGAAPLRCMDSRDGTPSATAGLLIGPSSGRTFDREGTQSWRCIRTTAADTTLNTSEALP